MLIDFQLESGQAITAKILANRQDIGPDIAYGQNSPTHEIRTFELPNSVWKVMFACYAIFFSALFVATGRGTSAIFALTVSILYAMMYFGTAAILNRISAPERATLPRASAAAGLATNTGWMSNSAVNAQILIVPVCLVIFSSSFAIIHALV